MTMNQLHSTLMAFLARIDSKTGTDLHTTFVGEALETGGTYLVPDEGDNATSHLLEISLHGIVGRGPTEPEALSDWQQAAQRLSKAIGTTETPDTCRGGLLPTPLTLPEAGKTPSPVLSNALGGQA